ncbi:Myb/SANT-like DNA-binding domain-domain-containing protein [Coniella lustricola]|uniref:Myb/SANT-like DNA-binding domain-domain-containing protein n=1 Tax=Coniella lustricola TaxID=2025994 RepID=A0A2T3AJD5_9PEZI|nr:Myb/SANT-like DNA-binding domain-domain-containing protein [Coniella lustricola]
MSDDEYGSPEAVQPMAANPGAVATRQNNHSSTPSHRKGPRFSWNPQYEATFFRSLCESVKMGLKDNHSFKPEAWDRACTALADRHNAYPTKSHLINKSDNARKKFRLWRGLREDPEFLYNPQTKIVTANEAAWRAHIEREPLSKSLRNRPFEHEDYMEILFPDVIGSGGAPRRITRPRRRGADALGDMDDMDGSAAGPGDSSNNSLMLLSPATNNQPATFQSGHAAILPATVSSRGTFRTGASAATNRTSVASSSALTPPDDDVPSTMAGVSLSGGPSRKHYLSSGNNAFPGGPSEKRRRTAINHHGSNSNNNFIDLTHSAQHLMNMDSTSNNNNHAQSQDGSIIAAGNNTTSAQAATHQAGVNNHNINGHHLNNVHSSGSVSRQQLSEAMLALNEFVRNFRNPPQQPQQPQQQAQPPVATAAPPSSSYQHATTPSTIVRWQEQAMETFFRDFAEEDADLQIRIGEKVLCDSHKAMMFCQMSEQLRRHWVRRLRELHNRHDTSSTSALTSSGGYAGGSGAGIGHVNTNTNTGTTNTNSSSQTLPSTTGVGGSGANSNNNNAINFGGPSVSSSSAGAGAAVGGVSAGLLNSASLGGVSAGTLLQQQPTIGAGALNLGRNGSG